MQTQQDFKSMAHPTVKDVIKIIVPEGTMQHLTCSLSRDLMGQQM